MALIKLAVISPTVGDAWTVEFTADSESAIKFITEFSIDVSTPNLPALFSVSSVNGYSGSSVQYVTWRSTSPAGQHPTSGWSMDIWNQTFYENIITYNNNNGMSWSQMLTGNGSGGDTYPLNSNKWSLLYNYDNTYSPAYTMGGTLRVSIS